MLTPVNRSRATHYVWGGVCDGYVLSDGPQLSVIEEVVPAKAGETRHVHRRARQFFYVLEGEAVLETPDGDVRLRTGDGVEVPPGTVHRFANPGEEPVRFLVVSTPTTRGDLTDLPDDAVVHDLAWEARVAAAWADPDEASIVERMTAIAADAPHPALGAFELGGALDSAGREEAAASHYERALAAGLDAVDPDRAAQLTIQYASTLRNLGRVDEAISLLAQSAPHPSTGAAREVFLGLALHSAGRDAEALQVLVDAIAPTLPRYRRSVEAYSRALTGDAHRAD